MCTGGTSTPLEELAAEDVPEELGSDLPTRECGAGSTAPSGEGRSPEEGTLEGRVSGAQEGGSRTAPESTRKGSQLLVENRETEAVQLWGPEEEAQGGRPVGRLIMLVSSG